MNINQIITSFIVAYAPRVIGAIIILLVGLWLIKKITKYIVKLMTKKEVSTSLIPFISSLINVLLKVMLVISVASIVGIETTSFIAVLGAIGLAVGMALSGTLQNFAGGVLILILKPFKVGDFIEAQGYAGAIKEIQIFSTFMRTTDNVNIIIPNGPLSTGPIKNYSLEETRRVDITFGIGYDDDLKKAKNILNDIITSHSKILKDPAPFIRMGELADSSVNITTRSWVKAADYWDVFFDLHETVKERFDQEGVSIPYPQTDVHLINQ